MPTNREISFILRLRDEATTAWNKFTADVKRGAGNIEAQFRKFGGLLAGAFSIGAIRSFVASSNEAEMATARLTAALKNQGINSRAAVAEMENFSSEMEATTVYADEVITNVQAMLVSMTGLTGDAVKPLTKATADLAAGMNLDIEAAAKLIAKTVEGSNALKKQGIDIGNTTTKAERIAAVVEGVTEKFGGMAEAIGKTSAGQMKQMANQLDNLQERFGDLIKSAIAPLIPALRSFVELLAAAPPYVQAMVLALGALTAAAYALNIPLGGLPILIGLVTVAAVGLVAAANSGSDALSASASSAEEYNGQLENIARTTGRVAGMTKNQLTAELERLNAEIATAKNAPPPKVQRISDPFGKPKVVTATGTEKDKTDNLKKMEDQARITAAALARLSSVTDGEVGSMADAQTAIKDKREALAQLEVGSGNYLRVLKEIWKDEDRLAESMTHAEIVARRGVEFFSTIPEVATVGLNADKIEEDTTKYFQKLREEFYSGVTKANAELKEMVIVVPDFVDTSNIEGLQAKIAAIQEQMAKADLGTTALLRLRDELDATQRKLDEALLTPFERGMAAVVEYGNVALDVFTQIQGIQDQVHAAQITNIRNELKAQTDAIKKEDAAVRRAYEREKKTITDQLKNENLSASQKAALQARMAALDEQYAVRSEQIAARQMAAEEEAAAKEAEIKRQQFISNKIAAVIMATINTAEAVTKAFTIGPFAGPVYAAIIGALGAAQIALIASQPIPKFHQGTGDDPVAKKIRNAPASKEFPILVRGGETIRTEAQERDVQRRIEAGADAPPVLVSVSGPDGSAAAPAERTAPATIIFNINSPLTDDEWVIAALEKRLRRTGLEITDVVVNRRRNVKV
jgi:hypothetical protein